MRLIVRGCVATADIVWEYFWAWLIPEASLSPHAGAGVWSPRQHVQEQNLLCSKVEARRLREGLHAASRVPIIQADNMSFRGVLHTLLRNKHVQISVQVR